MQSLKKDALSIVGISTRTSNGTGKAEIDIPNLWTQFMSKGIMESIPNKLNDVIFALYTDYESDHTGEYSVILGCQVSTLDAIPEELTVKFIPKSNYQKFTAKGDLTKDAVFNTWKEIWNTNLKRTYTTDIEVYGEKAINPKDGEADIFIAIN